MRTKKENREDILNESIKIRLTKKEKENFKFFCKNNKIDMSKFLREFVLQQIT